MIVDERLALLALVEGESWIGGGVVVHRDQTVLHVSTDEPLPLTVGEVVGLSTAGGSGSPVAVTLAMVAESIGATVTALRIIERRS